MEPSQPAQHHGLVIRANHRQPETRRSRRAGYVVAIVINAVLLYVANNLLSWDLLPFLTDDFDRVLPAVNLSLAVTIAVNGLRIIYDAPWFTRSSEIVSMLFSIAASVRLFNVFPFDFDDYSSVWEPFVRVLILIAIIGSAIGVIVQLFKLLTGLGAQSS
ncbi:MAG: hypothetical protein ACR2QK_16230 [Acidimicrobiales bacterium]